MVISSRYLIRISRRSLATPLYEEGLCAPFSRCLNVSLQHPPSFDENSGTHSWFTLVLIERRWPAHCINVESRLPSSTGCNHMQCHHHLTYGPRIPKCSLYHFSLSSLGVPRHLDVIFTFIVMIFVANTYAILISIVINMRAERR